jgi:hypothetical protein
VGYLMQSRTMLDAVEAVTALTGRMKGLPEWTQLGAVVGLEGGTANVTAIVDRMYEAGVPMAGMNVAVALFTPPPDKCQHFEWCYSQLRRTV